MSSRNRSRPNASIAAAKRHDGYPIGLTIRPDRGLSIHGVDHTIVNGECTMTTAERWSNEANQPHATQVLPPPDPTPADVFSELLYAIADDLDIRTVLSRVSTISNSLLSHDSLTLAFLERNGRVIEQATSTDDVSGIARLIESDAPGRSEIIIEDLLAWSPAKTEHHGQPTRVVAAGYRSLLGVVTRVREQPVTLTFLSKQPRAFSRHDVALARRIADHVTLAVSHEQLAKAARQASDARARTDHLEARIRMLANQADVDTHSVIVGRSAQWRDALKKATQVAATATTVLVTGESGTGKEVVARFIHRASARSKGPFVALNCAALPEQLLESELFGYERGAFTSADHTKPGRIELASNGVLFLDEVSEMSLSAQAKLLRVLQEREFQRLGGTRMLKANIRVVAATNRDLRDAIERRTFREDLFYRLHVFEVRIAPLRERQDDILPLAEAFLRDIARSSGGQPARLTPGARQALLAYSWPGNVRELRNALERGAILCEGDLIDSEHLVLQGARRSCEPPLSDLGTVEREMIANIMRQERSNKAKSARRLGITRTQLYYRLRKYGLEN
jgi:transcriptional regulator with PAS, ATPase and Fis domain